MATNQYATVIYIDQRERRVHYYANSAGAEPVHDTQAFKSRALEKEFYPELTSILQGFLQRYTPAAAANTTIVLPDSAFMTDTVSLPAMKRGALQRSLDTTLGGLIKDRKSVRVQSFVAAQTKQFYEICVSGVREELLKDVRTAAAEAKLMAQNVTFAAECTARGAVALNSKLKGGTYLFMDVKASFTRLVYVLHGEAVSFYTLPFGYDILSANRLTAEDMLFDHSVAELAVLNARERAKSKALTMMGGDGTVDAGDVDTDQAEEEAPVERPESEPAQGEDEEEDEDDRSDTRPTVNRTENAIKTLPKKQPRKLPKYMLRPQPETEDGYLYENFRIFEKWALCFLAGNERLTRLAAPEAVYMHMPERFSGVLEQLKEEETENGVPFRMSGITAPSDLIGEHLEMYGGLFVRQEKKMPLVGGLSHKGGAHNVF